MPGNISVITFCSVAMPAFPTPLIRQEKSGERSSQFPPSFLGQHYTGSAPVPKCPVTEPQVTLSTLKAGQQSS